MTKHRRRSLKELASFCRRTGTSLSAGVDLRKSLDNEVGRGSTAYSAAISEVRQRVAQGETLAVAVARCGDAFPPLFQEMLDAGEQTGHVDGVLLRLADHYEHLQTLRRIFLLGILWPAIQLIVAIFVIGLLIWVLGLVGVDTLGWGLTGTSGLLIYLTIVGLLFGGIGVFVWGTFRGWPWSRSVFAVMRRVPVIAASFETIALSQMAWAMSLVFNTEMEAVKAMRLAIKSSSYPVFITRSRQIEAALEAGEPIHRALRQAGVFPDDFVDAVHVGEDSGRLAESMGHLADQYRSRAEAAFKALTVVAAFLVWGLVAVFLIAMIFQLASFYIKTIQDAASGNF